MFIVFDVETTGLNYHTDSLRTLIVGMSEKGNLSYRILGEDKTSEEIKQFFSDVIKRFPDATYVAHNIKFDLHFLGVHPDTVDKLSILDTTVLYHYHYPRKPKKLDEIETELFGTDVKKSYLAEFGKDQSKWPIEPLLAYQKNDVVVCNSLIQLAEKVDPKWLTFQNNLIKALYRMEHFGFPYDEEQAKEVEKELSAYSKTHVDVLRSGLAERGITDKVNFNSPKQVSKLFYTDLAIPKPNRDLFPSGKAFDKKFSSTMTDKDILGAINHPIVTQYLYVKKISSLLSFVKSYGKNSFKGRLHPSFNVTGAITGRLSCVVPNTKVLTKRGEIEIQNLSEGDFVWTHKHRWQKVVHLIEQPVQHVYEITFCNGNVLTCTSDHSMLLSDTWTSLDSIGDKNGTLKKFLAQSRQRTESVETVQRQRLPINGKNSGGVRDTSSNGRTYPSDAYVRRGTKLIEEIPVSNLENWIEEPYERKSGRSASQLYRRSGRWLRVSNSIEKREKTICTSCRNGRSSRGRRDPIKFSSAPYRRRSKEQRNRQFGIMYKRRTWDHTLYADQELFGYGIEKIRSVGYSRTFDITVEQDHSYLSEGIFSHNCSSPNLQNISKKEIEGFTPRSLFRPEDGEKLVSIDYQQQEIRMLAVLSGDENLLDLCSNGGDIHAEIGKAMFGDAYTNEYRTVAKNTSFGLLYGLSLPSLAWQMGKSLDETQWFLASYFERFPKVEAWMSDVKAEAEITGGITLFSGRRWESIPGLEYQAINAYVQGSSAELTNIALICCTQLLKRTGKGRVLSQIHDELLFSVNDLDIVPELQKTMELESLFGVKFLTDVEVSESY